MRRATGLLMDGAKPAGGQWNFDPENRKRLPKGKRVPARQRIAPNATTREVMAEIASRFPDNFGTLSAFNYATNGEEAAQVLDHFIAHLLPEFGDWQDAMVRGEPLMWHAHISAAMNIGLIDPVELSRPIAMGPRP
jgi:deoxyribodipyrimidine photolyase-related protein